MHRAVVAAVVALAAPLWASPAASPAPRVEVPPCPSATDAPDVARLVERTQALLQGRTSTGTMVMTITTPQWTRTLKLQTWAKGEELALLRVVEGGPRETGMMTLKRDKQLWNWLPRAARVMKLPSGMLGDSWMGSDFTNDDLVRGNSLADDFVATVKGTVDVQGKRAWQVSLVPKPSAAVVWGRVELLIDRSTCLPIEQRFFDEDDKLTRRLELSDFKRIGWRDFPTRMTIHPAEPGRQTTIVYQDIAFDIDITDDTFSLHRLQQGR
ncbi:MAG: outer membrane lipoprotein-sorting protein [Deltaproteobacteria bacterium]|nr:outer membrane lipoprotein-sorting protein [Deltaproteobacteria bacterium]